MSAGVRFLRCRILRNCFRLPFEIGARSPQVPVCGADKVVSQFTSSRITSRMRLELSTQALNASPGLSAGLSQWRVGAIVEAVAVRGIDNGQLWLNIGAAR